MKDCRFKCLLLRLTPLYEFFDLGIVDKITHIARLIFCFKHTDIVKYGKFNQFSSVQSLSHVWLCDPMDCSTPGLPVHHELPEFTQTHLHWVDDAIQTFCPLSSPSPPAFNLSQHQGLFKWVTSSQWVRWSKGLKFQLQHQSFQWIFRTDLL